MSKYAAPRAWVNSLYVGALNLTLDSIGPELTELLSDFPARFEDFDHPEVKHPALSGRRRINRFIALKTRFPLSAAGYCGVELSARLGGRRSVYAYVYWRRDRAEAGCIGGTPEYICTGPTFSSSDGEYRSRFIPYETFAATAQAEGVAAVLAVAERCVLSSLELGTLALDQTEHPAAGGMLTAWVRANRLEVVALAVVLAVDTYTRAGLEADGHVSADYLALLGGLVEENPALVDASARVWNEGDTDWKKFVAGANTVGAVRCGQKLVPMTRREVVTPGSLVLPAWKELAVSQLVGDLVINFVAPGFACYGQWAYLEGAGPQLFENPEMMGKYERNELVLAALRSLQGTSAELERASGGSELARLRDEVRRLTEAASRDLVLSRVAMLHTLEDVGQTLWGHGNYVRHTKFAEHIEDAFSSRETSAARLFEFLHSARCLHEKLGVCHTDLHGNNLTLFFWGAAARTRERLAVTLYVTGPNGADDCYLLAANGASGCVIDYSRCVLGPAFRAQARSGRPEPAEASEEDAAFSGGAVRALRRHAAELVTPALEAKLRSLEPDVLFGLTCAVDYIAIGASVASFALEAATAGAGAPGEPAGHRRPFVVAEECSAMARKVETLGRDALVASLQAVAAGHKPKPLSALWATVSAEVFAPWKAAAVLADPARRGRLALADAYNFTNSLVYSSTDYARFPPWARLDELQKRLGDAFADLVPRGPELLLEAVAPPVRPEVVAAEVSTELAGLREDS